MSTELLAPEVMPYLDGLVPARHPELQRMEADAEKTDFPIIGPAAGTPQAVATALRVMSPSSPTLSTARSPGTSFTRAISGIQPCGVSISSKPSTMRACIPWSTKLTCPLIFLPRGTSTAPVGPTMSSASLALKCLPGCSLRVSSVSSRRTIMVLPSCTTLGATLRAALGMGAEVAAEAATVDALSGCEAVVGGSLMGLPLRSFNTGAPDCAAATSGRINSNAAPNVRFVIIAFVLFCPGESASSGRAQAPRLINPVRVLFS